MVLIFNTQQVTTKVNDISRSHGIEDSLEKRLALHQPSGNNENIEVFYRQPAQPVLALLFPSRPGDSDNGV
jgi:hypothetical protein